MASTEEVIDELLERMKAPDLAKKAFDDLAQRIRTLQSLIQEK